MATNRFKGEATIKCSRGALKFMLDLNAMAEFESLVGASAFDAIERIEEGNPRISDMRGLLCAGLQRHHPEISLFDAGDILAEDPEALTEALSAAFPESDGGQGNAKAGKARRAKKA